MSVPLGPDSLTPDYPLRCKSFTVTMPCGQASIPYRSVQKARSRVFRNKTVNFEKEQLMPYLQPRTLGGTMLAKCL